MWYLCLFHVSIWGRSQSLHWSTQIWCFSLPLVHHNLCTKSVPIALCRILFFIDIPTCQSQPRPFWEISRVFLFSAFASMYFPLHKLKTHIKTKNKSIDRQLPSHIIPPTYRLAVDSPGLHAFGLQEETRALRGDLQTWGEHSNSFVLKPGTFLLWGLVACFVTTSTF